jgi:hypothetical protein
MLGSIVLAIEGDDKSGKTSLALSAPGPIYHMDVDVGGYNRASHRFRALAESGQIFSKTYHPPKVAILNPLRQKLIAGQRAPTILKPSFKLEGWSEAWYEMLQDFADVLEDKIVSKSGEPFKTIIADSWPMVWDFCTRGFLQEVQTRNPSANRSSLIEIEYGEPNARMRTMIYAARQMGKNLVCTHQLTEVREERIVNGDIKTVVIPGQFKHTGWRHMDKEVDLTVRVEFRDYKPKGSTDPEQRLLIPYGTVRLCGLAVEPTGQELKDPTWGKLVQLVEMYRG